MLSAVQAMTQETEDAEREREIPDAETVKASSLAKVAFFSFSLVSPSVFASAFLFAAAHSPTLVSYCFASPDLHVSLVQFPHPLL